MYNEVKNFLNIGISIIIPVFNAEKYIKKCLDSLLFQTFTDFEIICVDDGSTDYSLKILREYQEMDERIHIYTQRNLYAGVARNNGMKKASGKYLLFLDSDDFFCEEMLEKLWNKAEIEKSEIVVFDAFEYDNQLKEVINTTWKALQKNSFDNGIKSAQELAEIIFDFTVPAPWNKLFLNDFIKKNNLWFQPIKRTNDLYFVYSALSSASRISILNEKLMYYRVNNQASLQGSGEETPDVFVKALEELHRYLLLRDTWKFYKKSFENMAATITVYNMNNMKSQENYLLLYNILKESLFPKILIKNKKRESLLLQEIQQKKEIIIYGAGAVAKAIIDFLLYCYSYDRDKILVVVSNLNQNVKTINNIDVKLFSELEVEKKSNLVLIAVNDEKIQNEIQKKVSENGFYKVERIGNMEIIEILKNMNNGE